MRLNRLYLLLFIVFFLSACGKKEPTAPPGFGQLDSSVVSESTKSGKEISVKSSESSNIVESSGSVSSESPTADEFTITENVDFSKTSEDYSMDKAESEAEPYIYEDVFGEEHDIRETAGLNGLLSYIYSQGGTSQLSTLDREILSNDFDWYFAVTDEEKETLLDIIYNGSDEEKKELDEAALHTQEGWVYTDEGWKDVYAETNAPNPNIGSGLN